MKHLLHKITSKKAVVGIIGLGYMGLTLFEEFRKAGFSLVGYDRNVSKIQSLKKGKAYLTHLPLEDFFKALRKKTCSVSSDPSILKKADVLIISVRTSLDIHQMPDLSCIQDAIQLVSRYAKKQTLVVLQSTPYPGATEEDLRPSLEKAGYKVGKDIFLAFVPEITDIGNTQFTFKELPKIIGGVTPNCFKVAKALYQFICSKVIHCSSPKIAECAKLLQNTYRFVNIALINEMKIMFDRMGIDIWEVIEKASSKPFGFTPFYPSPGIGGDCIPVVPFYLTWKAKEFEGPTSMIDLAGHINLQTPYYVIQKIQDALNSHQKSVKDSRILVLGVGFKKDIADLREAPSLKILSLLKGLKAQVFYHDPFVPNLKFPQLEMKSIAFETAKLKTFDCVVICTDHSMYDWKKITKESSLIVDTRNVTDKISHAKGKIFKA